HLEFLGRDGHLELAGEFGHDLAERSVTVNDLRDGESEPKQLRAVLGCRLSDCDLHSFLCPGIQANQLVNEDRDSPFEFPQAGLRNGFVQQSLSTLGLDEGSMVEEKVSEGHVIDRAILVPKLFMQGLPAYEARGA